MRDAQDADDLERLLAARGTQLLRTAVLLTGSRTDGEDLMQAALERLVRQGRRISGNPEIRALHLLPPQQRAAVVLRHWEQLSDAEAAEVLGCSPGTVKAVASRGLRRLRELASPWLESEFELTEKGT